MDGINVLAKELGLSIEKVQFLLENNMSELSRYFLIRNLTIVLPLIILLSGIIGYIFANAYESFSMCEEDKTIKVWAIATFIFSLACTALYVLPFFINPHFWTIEQIIKLVK